MKPNEIIKALECCEKQKSCSTCPCDKFCGGPYVLDNKALSLIKELTKENETLRLKVGAYQVKDALLSSQLDDKCDRCIARERADTVRKMQERLKQHYVVDTDDGLYGILDQIAKEMLGNAEGGENDGE